MADRYLLMTDTQKEYVNMVRQILNKELAPHLKEYEEKEEFPISVLKTLADAGFYGMDIPEAYGGLGLDNMTCALIFEEMARVDAGFAFNYQAASAGFKLFELAKAPEAMKHYYAGKIMAGSMGSFAVTEPGAGSDSAAMQTTAVRQGDEYILNGTKCFITNAPIADMFLIAAYTDKSKGPRGVSMFLVERKHGVQVGKPENKMGLRLSLTGDVILEDVHIPAANLIGEEGKGFIYAMKMIEEGRITSMVHALGIAQSAMDHAAKYSKERIAFGKPIIQHQGLGFVLADMQTRVDAARALIYYSISLLDKGIPVGTLSPSTKLFASEAVMQVTIDAVQVMGGYGYMKDYPVEKLMRDAKIFSIFEGTTQINKMVSAGIIAREY